MMYKFFRIGMLISILSIVSGCGLFSDSVTSSVAATTTAKEVIKEAQSAVNHAVTNAEQSGHNLVAHAAYQLDFAVQQTDHRLGVQREKAFKDIDKSMQKVISSISNAADSINKGGYQLSSLEDNLALDLQKTLGNIPFVDNPYVLRRVQGIQQVKLHAIGYRLTLVGSGFGEVTPEKRTGIKLLSVDGKDITQDVAVYRRSGNALTIEIKNKALSPIFSDEMIVADVAMIISEQSFDEESSLWENEKDIPYNFNLYLYPRTGATLISQGKGEYFDFVENGKFCVNFVTPNNHCSDDCDESNSFPLGKNYRYHGEKPVPNFKHMAPFNVGNNRLVPGTVSSVLNSGPRGWQSNLKTSVKESGRVLTLSLNTWTRSKKFRVCANQETYSSTGYKNYKDEIRVPFEDTFHISLPKNPKLSEFELRLSSGEKINGVLKEGRNYLNGRFKILGIEEVGDHTVVLAQLKPPQHIRVD